MCCEPDIEPDSEPQPDSDPNSVPVFATYDEFINRVVSNFNWTNQFALFIELLTQVPELQGRARTILIYVPGTKQGHVNPMDIAAIIKSHQLKNDDSAYCVATGFIEGAGYEDYITRNKAVRYLLM